MINMSFAQTNRVRTLLVEAIQSDKDKQTLKHKDYFDHHPKAPVVKEGQAKPNLRNLREAQGRSQPKTSLISSPLEHRIMYTLKRYNIVFFGGFTKFISVK